MGSLFAFAGFLLVLGIGGTIWDMMDRIKFVQRHFDRLFNSLPMGWEEAKDLSKR